jgi:hypothetical protein
MRIEFERSGGFAGLRLSGRVDTSELPAEQACPLEELVAAAQFWDLPGEIQGDRREADRFEYVVTVVAEDRRHTVQVGESAMSEEMRALIDAVTRLARRRT